MPALKFAYPPQSDMASSTAISTPRAQSPESPRSDSVLIESYNPSSIHRRDSPPAPAKPASKRTTTSPWYLPASITSIPGFPRTVPESVDSTPLSATPAPAPVLHWYIPAQPALMGGSPHRDHDKKGTMGSPMPATAPDKVRDMQQISSPTELRSPVGEPTTPEVGSPRMVSQSGNGTRHTQPLQLHRNLSPMVAVEVTDAVAKTQTVPPVTEGWRSASVSSISRSGTPASLVGENAPVDTITSTRVVSPVSPVDNILPSSSLIAGIPSSHRQTHTPILNVHSTSRRKGKSDRIPNYSVVRLQSPSHSSTSSIVVAKSPHRGTDADINFERDFGQWFNIDAESNVSPAANVSGSDPSRRGIPAALRPVPFPDRAYGDPWGWDTSQRYTPQANHIPVSVDPNLQPVHQQIPFTGYAQPAAPISQPIHHPQRSPPIPLQPVYQHTAPNNYQPPPTRLHGVVYPRNSTRFFFEDGTYSVRVRDVLYKVHKHVLCTSPFLTKELNNWRFWSTFDPYDLTRFCKPREFELLLSIFYPRDYTQWEVDTVKDWTSVLRLASEFDMKNIRALAIKQLFPITAAAEKIELANKYDIKDWLMPAYMDLCTRTEDLTVDEGNKMGIEAVIGITKMRNQLLANVKNLVEKN